MFAIGSGVGSYDVMEEKLPQPKFSRRCALHIAVVMPENIATSFANRLSKTSFRPSFRIDKISCRYSVAPSGLTAALASNFSYVNGW